MAGSSNQTTYNGVTPAKPILGFDNNNSAGERNLRHYRLESFVNSADSVPRASSASPSHIQSSRKARTAAELEALTRRLC
ncbi:hypothetical protein F4810DRAFT_710976 [Camillea tinctor]|nr:hypothetical protein F4810DRAFT_710976 [Camillea tinctor]